MTSTDPLPPRVAKDFPDAKYVAEVQLFIDMKHEGSSATLGRLGGTSYIVLAPKGIDKITDKKHLFTVLAHELGHWIAKQNESPSHDTQADILAKLTGDGHFLIPAEREAWDWASEIMPDLDPQVKTEALATYGDTPQHARFR